MLNIIFEDENYLAINKPSLQHTSYGAHSNSLAEEIVLEFPELQHVGGINNAGLISRLDYETSGLILAVKSDNIKVISPVKTYLACLDGELKNKIDSALYLGQSSRNSKKVRVFENEPKKSYRAQLSHTKISPITSSNNKTLIEAEISSGLRHQIRSHCAFYGFPLTGDLLYGSQEQPPFLLHSYMLQFVCSKTKKSINLKASAPNSLKSYFPGIDLSLLK